MLDWGGDPYGHAAAQRQSWDEVRSPPHLHRISAASPPHLLLQVRAFLDTRLRVSAARASRPERVSPSRRACSSGPEPSGTRPTTMRGRVSASHMTMFASTTGAEANPNTMPAHRRRRRGGIRSA